MDNNVRIRFASCRSLVLTHGSISSYLRARDLKVVDCDWISEHVPVVATSDGCIRVMDRSLSISNSPLLYTTLQKPIYTPHVLPTLSALQLKVLLQHYAGDKFTYEPESPQRSRSSKLDGSTEIELSLLDCVDYKLLKELQVLLLESVLYS